MDENSNSRMNHATFVFNGEGKLLESSLVKFRHSGAIAVLALEDMAETHQTSWSSLKDRFINTLQCLKQDATETEIRSFVHVNFSSSHGFSLVSLGVDSHDDERKFTEICNPQLSNEWSSPKCYSEHIKRIRDAMKLGLSAISPEIMMCLPDFCLNIFLISFENDTRIRFFGEHKCTVENGDIIIPGDWAKVNSSKIIVKQSCAGNYWEVYPEANDFAKNNCNQQSYCEVDSSGRLLLPPNVKSTVKPDMETQVITLIGCGWGFLIPFSGNS